MALFGEKISKEKYEELEEEYSELLKEYEKLISDFEEEKEKIKDSFTLQFQRQAKEKNDIDLKFKRLKKLHQDFKRMYENELTVALKDLLMLKNDYEKVLKEDDSYIYIKRDDYLAEYNDESIAINSLKVYRELDIIETGKNAYTKTKRFGKESIRYIWFKKDKISAIEKYFKKSV